MIFLNKVSTLWTRNPTVMATKSLVAFYRLASKQACILFISLINISITCKIEEEDFH